MIILLTIAIIIQVILIYELGFVLGYKKGQLDGSNEALCKKVRKEEPYLEHIIITINGIEMDGLIDQKEQRIKVSTDKKDYNIMKDWFLLACNSTLASDYKRVLKFNANNCTGEFQGTFCSSTTPFSSIIRYDVMKYDE